MDDCRTESVQGDDIESIHSVESLAEKRLHTKECRNANEQFSRHQPSLRMECQQEMNRGMPRV